jgi:hypothetical protein
MGYGGGGVVCPSDDLGAAKCMDPDEPGISFWRSEGDLPLLQVLKIQRDSVLHLVVNYLVPSLNKGCEVLVRLFAAAKCAPEQKKGNDD